MTKLSLLKSSLKQLLIAIDQLIHTLIGLVLVLLAYLKLISKDKVKLWYADETFSSHCWRWNISGKRDCPRMIIDTIFFWESNHCMESYESERLHLQFPPELRAQ